MLKINIGKSHNDLGQDFKTNKSHLVRKRNYSKLSNRTTQLEHGQIHSNK